MQTIAHLWWLWTGLAIAGAAIAGRGMYRIQCIDTVAPESQADRFFATIPYLGTAVLVLAFAALAAAAGFYHLLH